MAISISQTMAWSRVWISGFIFLALCPWIEALDIAYCSPDNNSGGSGSLSSIWMSNGKCHDNCIGSYVFAVLQGDQCYCSNYVPANQVNTNQCSQSCPGFPSDLCGNQDAGLYAYISLGGNPSGTSGSSSSPVTSSVSTIPNPSGNSFSSPTPRVVHGTSSPVTSSMAVLTNNVTPQSSAEPSSSSVVSSTDSETVSATSTSLNSDSSITSSPTQVYTSVISVTGKVSTIVITPTAKPDSSLSQSNSKGGLSGGTVAGIVIGVAVGIGAIIGLVVWLWLRRRHQQNIDAISEGGSYASPSNASKHGNTGMPSRQVSQLSSAGLLTKIPRIQTGGLGFFDNPKSAGTGNSNQDRTSTHMTVDQRLNPWAIYSNEDSRASNVSLQDNQDYSRQLRVANPDP